MTIDLSAVAAPGETFLLAFIVCLMNLTFGLCTAVPVEALSQAVGSAGLVLGAALGTLVASADPDSLGLCAGLDSGEAAPAVAVPFTAGLAPFAVLPLTDGAGLEAREGKLSSSRVGGAYNVTASMT